MSKSFLIDTTRCTACRGCQVACKQWHGLPAEKTKNIGSYQNPPDLSFDTYKLVRMKEEIVEGRLRWLFFPDQCRHCIEPPCRDVAGDPMAIFSDPATGAVLYTAATKELDAEEITASCPYNIPRASSGGVLAKCDMCIDRVQNGLDPACVKACPTGAMAFGERDEIMEKAKAHLATARKKHPRAQLLDPDDVRVIYLVAYDPLLYHSNAVADAATFDINRQVALRRMMRPFTDFLSRLG
ncbi:MAG: formate dehydrogenase [Desulfosarcina sp.]|nr:formate dehydrogenase [Desulfobacterales bacterium]